MRVSEVERYLVDLYKKGTALNVKEKDLEKNGAIIHPSVLMLGAPGIGKSESANAFSKAISKVLGREYIEYTDDRAQDMIDNPKKYYPKVDIRLTETEPCDLTGIPREHDGFTRYSPLLWARTLSLMPGTLMLDELTNVVRPDVISASYKVIFDRMAGFIKFDPMTQILICGNRPEHSSVASMLPTPLLSRCIIIDVEPPALRDWTQYMNDTYGEHWDKRCYAFLKAYEGTNYLIQVPRTAEGLDAYPVPRTWTMLSRLMSRGADDSYTIEGLIGKEVGSRFRSFLKVEVNLEDLLKEPARWKTLPIEGKYMSTILLSNWIAQNIKKDKVEEGFKLIDVMCTDSNEFLALITYSLQRDKVMTYLTKLKDYNEAYFPILKEIFLTLRLELKV